MPAPSDDTGWVTKNRAESLTGKDMSYCKCGTKDEVGGFTCGQHCSRISKKSESPRIGNLIQTDVRLKFTFLPQRVKKLTELEIRNRVEDVEEKFARWFGGFTTTEAEGGYMDENDNLISEQIFIVSGLG